MPLTAAIADFIAYKRHFRGLAASSCATMGAHLRRFERALPPGATMDTAAPLVEPFLIDLARRGRSEWYRVKAFRFARDFFKWAHDHGRAAANPLRDARAPMVHERPRQFLTPAQVARLLDAIRRAPTTHAARDYALFACLYYAMLRVGEACRARFDDFDLGAGRVLIFGKGSKIRRIPFHPNLTPILRAWIRERPQGSALMFPSEPRNWGRTGTLGTDRVQRVLRDVYAPRAGLAGLVTPHALRRSAADHLRRGGAPLESIQQILRHESITTTMKYLQMQTPDELAGAWDKL